MMDRIDRLDDSKRKTTEGGEIAYKSQRRSPEQSGNRQD